MIADVVAESRDHAGPGEGIPRSADRCAAAAVVCAVATRTRCGRSRTSARVSVSRAEATGTWTCGLGKNRDLPNTYLTEPRIEPAQEPAHRARSVRGPTDSARPRAPRDSECVPYRLARRRTAQTDHADVSRATARCPPPTHATDTDTLRRRGVSADLDRRQAHVRNTTRTPS